MLLPYMDLQARAEAEGQLEHAGGMQTQGLQETVGKGVLLQFLEEELAPGG